MPHLDGSNSEVQIAPGYTLQAPGMLGSVERARS